MATVTSLPVPAAGSVGEAGLPVVADGEVGAGVASSEDPAAAAAAAPIAPTGPPAVETLYINNLNEKISLKVMKQTLRNLFRQYGTVLDVVAHRNVRMRGQAFVAMTDREAAARAVKEVRGFPLYGKPIQTSFARTPADAVVKRKTPNLLSVHVKERKKLKKISRRRNPLRKKTAAAQWAAKQAASGDPSAAGAAAAPAAKRNIVQMPDEYLPPNKTLFVQNLPDGITKDQLEALFSPYPNLYDVRLIPSRKGIAFVEYADEQSSSAAREALHNYKVDAEHKMKVTFQKQL